MKTIMIRNDIDQIYIWTSRNYRIWIQHNKQNRIRIRPSDESGSETMENSMDRKDRKEDLDSDSITTKTNQNNIRI